MKLREFDIDRDFDTVSRWFTLLGKTLLKKSSPPPIKVRIPTKPPLLYCSTN